MKYHLLLLYTTMNHFLNVMNMTFNEKWIEHDNCDDWLRGWIKKKKSSKAIAKAKLAPKKTMITTWWSASNLMHYSFLNLSKPITSEMHVQQIDEMH